MHKLLARQLKRHLGTVDIPEPWAALLQTVDTAYQQYDTDRLMLERSLELTSEDLNARYVELQRDVERRLAVERELAATKEAAEVAAEHVRLAEMRSRFVTQASHEFRTPLAVILAATDLLGRYDGKMEPAERRRRLAKIRTSVQEMNELLEDVLAYGRAGAGSHECVRHPVVLRPLCEEILAAAAATATATQNLVLACDPTLMAELDSKLTRQILSNLLTNAVKYSPAGSTVTLTATRRDGAVELRVADHGIGISPEDQVRLFEPFHRGHNVGNLPGYGLGLAITKEAVASHAGTIQVESAVGVGTTFTVVLPDAGAVPR